ALSSEPLSLSFYPSCFISEVLDCVVRRFLVDATVESARARQFHTVVEVLSNLTGVVGVIERQTFRVGKTHRHRSPQLSSRDVISEIWIAKVRHPIERIKGRMIDAVVAATT